MQKQETIERLLKKPIGRRSGASTSRIAAATKVDRSAINLPVAGGVDASGQAVSVATAPAVLPTMFRWISSIKDGEYKETWAVPMSLEDRFAWPSRSGTDSAEAKAAQITYPGPRPPPKTRLLNKAGETATAGA